MKIIIALTLLFTACNSSSSKKTIDNIQPENTKITTKVQDTFLINNLQFVQVLNDHKFNGLLSLKGDTIIKSEDYYSECKFLDIDEDGYKDIRIFVFSNTPNQCENYLFYKDQNTFKKIENCNLEIQKIKETDYYYSYNRAGSSDMNWESHLSIIENLKKINIGYMSVKGCGEEDDGIEIYKITNGTEKELLKIYPIVKFDNNNSNNKWNYLENYWTNNYKKFGK